MKKRFLLNIVFLFLLTSSVLGQQRPHYTQYIINPYLINPAITGIENYTDLKLGLRNQWVGIKGAPTTAYLTVHTPLGKSNYDVSATSFNVPGQNPRGSEYWRNYEAAEPHHGVGINIINDKTGSFNFFSASASYAYHLALNTTTNLSGGFSAGITKVNLDRSNHDFDGSGDMYDPALGSALGATLTKTRPTASVGLWLYSRDYFVGFSAQQLVHQNLQFIDDIPNATTKGKFIPHLFMTAGYRLLLSEDINAIPSVMVKYIRGNSDKLFQPEANIKLQYRDLLWVGGSYRYEDSFAALLGVNVKNTLNVSYSYDMSHNKHLLNKFNNGTHEIVLGFLLGNKYSDNCPRCW